MLPNAAKLLVLGSLSIAWLTLHQRALRLEPAQVYHLASQDRDKRKAQFYFRSVWAGLLAAFIAFGALEVSSNYSFDTIMAREGTLGVLRGIGIWGLLVIVMVWTRIGSRASQINLDGQSLTPYREDLDDPKK